MSPRKLDGALLKAPDDPPRRHDGDAERVVQNGMLSRHLRRISSDVETPMRVEDTAGAGFPDTPADARVPLGFPAPT